MSNSSRKIWEQPWGYQEGFIAATGILLAGVLLQITLGSIELSLFATPVNTIIGALFVVGLLIVYLFFRKRKIIRWLSGVYATIPAIAIIIFLCIILGIVPQFTQTASPHIHTQNIFSLLGWHQMTSSWPFVIMCYYLLFILGLATLRRTGRKQSWRDIGFYLNHLGLFIALLGGLMGSADLERLTMTVSEGQVEWRANNRDGDIVELSLAIQLDGFRIEEYEPRLVVIETVSGKMLPSSKPENYMFKEVGNSTSLAGVTVEVLDYLPNAAIFRDSTFMNIVPMLMDGATSAIKARVTKPGMDAPAEGWVSNGSYLFPHLFLEIDELTSLAMPPQEVKKYSSFVTVYSEKGLNKEAIIEVNKPLRAEEWVIYQYSYDDYKGRYSDTSTFELVRDPSLKFVYTGIFMLLVGAIFIFVAGPKKSESKTEKL